MMKSFLITIQIIGVLIFALSQKQAIKLTHDAPISLKPGEEVVVNISLDKSDVLGFAKYQITLDEGLTAESVDPAGASFTFNNQTAKFIWMALPSNRKINLTVRIKAAADAIGMLQMNQRFSYIYNNERKNYDAPKHSIMVGEGAAIQALQIKKSIAEKEKNLEAQVNSKRTITNAGINQWRVEIQLDKKHLSGFAKIEETVPSGYTVIDLKASGAIFSIDDSNIKYIWYDLPETDVVTVAYKMLPVIAMEANKPEVSGSFSFLKNDLTVTIPIGKSYATEPAVEEIPEEPAAMVEKVVEEQVAEVIKSEPTPVTEPKKVTTEPAKPTQKETAPATTPAKPKEPEAKTTTEKAYTDANIVDVPMPETGVYYRVQIAAGKNNLSLEVFSKMYKFTEGFKLENHQGWFKYTTGHHQVYRAARNDRERINGSYSTFKGPFVTAYNDGERISVQEALMITSQKWVP